MFTGTPRHASPSGSAGETAGNHQQIGRPANRYSGRTSPGSGGNGQGLRSDRFRRPRFIRRLPELRDIGHHQRHPEKIYRIDSTPASLSIGRARPSYDGNSGLSRVLDGELVQAGIRVSGMPGSEKNRDTPGSAF